MDLELQKLARRMLSDYDARMPNQCFCQPTTLTIERAYELQTAVARLREERGERIIGYKVGCISPVIQQQLGISEPITGRLFDTECHPSGARLSCAKYACLAIEGELAVRLAADVPETPLTDEEYLDCIGETFPVIELHHYVLRSPEACCQELIACSGMNAGFVMAECCGPARACVHPLLTISMQNASLDAVADASGDARPIASLRWLAVHLAAFGLRLSRGQVILTGSPMKLFPVRPGIRVVVREESLGASSAEFVP